MKENKNITTKELLNHIKKGFSWFTVKNRKSGGQITFRVATKMFRHNTPLFIAAKTSKKLLYLGKIDDIGKTPVVLDVGLEGNGSEQTKTFEWILRQINKDSGWPKEIEVWKGSTCRKCGKRITRLDDIWKGVGPGCQKRE